MPYRPHSSTTALRLAHEIHDSAAAAGYLLGLEPPLRLLGPVDLYSRAGDQIWTPIVGTVAMAVTKRLAWAADDGWAFVDVRDLATAVGVGMHMNAHAPVIRALSRAVSYGLITWLPEKATFQAGQWARSPRADLVDRVRTAAWSAA